MRLLWGECTWEDIAQAAREDYIVVLPAGAIEQHGPMLPVDVDARLAERWAADAAQRAQDKYGLNVLVLPALPYGQSCIHMKFPGTISFRFETYIAALSDILRAVADTGFRSILVCNGNGGNEHSIQVARYKLTEELTRASREVRLYVYPGWSDSYFQSELTRLREAGMVPEEPLGVHAAASETAEMLADRPHLVKREKMVRPTLKRDALPGYVWRTDEMTETGAFGDPSLATPELGTAFWEAVIEGIARYLVRISEETGSGKKH
jgi:creatinine amidohydrolase